MHLLYIRSFPNHDPKAILSLIPILETEHRNLWPKTSSFFFVFFEVVLPMFFMIGMGGMIGGTHL